MSYAIIGFGAVGQALARAFARKNIEVAVASRRPPEALLPQAQAIGSTVIPKTLREAIKADIIFLAVPFLEHREVVRGQTRHREPNCHRLEPFAHLVQLEELVLRERADDGAPARPDGDEPLGREPADRLAKRSAADAELLRERHLSELRAGLQATRQDLLP